MRRCIRHPYYCHSGNGTSTPPGGPPPPRCWCRRFTEESRFRVRPHIRADLPPNSLAARGRLLTAPPKFFVSFNMLRFLNIRNIVRAVDFNKSVTEPTRTKKGTRVITLKAGMCLGCLAWMFSVPTYAARYSIEVLPDPITEASGINARGDIVGGNFVFEQRTHAVSTLSCSGTGCSVLGATAINDLGVIAGAVVDPNVGPEAAIWKSASELPTLLSPGLQTEAAAISDLGDVAGNSNNGHEDNAADLWTAPSYPEIPLGTLVTCEFCVFDPSSTAAAVNNRRRVVGSADFGYITTSDPYVATASGVPAFMWSDGHMTDL